MHKQRATIAISDYVYLWAMYPVARVYICGTSAACTWTTYVYSADSAANCLNAHLLGWFRFMCGFTELPEYGELLQFPSNFRSALENVSAAVAANVSCHAANEREN